MKNIFRKSLLGILLLVGVLFVSCGDGDIKYLKGVKFGYDKTLTFGQAVDGMKNKKSARYYKEKDDKGRELVVVEIVIADCDKFFFEPYSYNTKIYPAEKSGSYFDGDISNLITSYGQNLFFAEFWPEDSEYFISNDDALSLAMDQYHWSEKQGEYPIRSENRYYKFENITLTCYANILGKGKERHCKMSKGFVKFEIKPIDREKITLMDPFGNNMSGIFNMIYKDMDYISAVR